MRRTDEPTLHRPLPTRLVTALAGCRAEARGDAARRRFAPCVSCGFPRCPSCRRPRPRHSPKRRYSSSKGGRRVRLRSTRSWGTRRVLRSGGWCSCACGTCPPPRTQVERCVNGVSPPRGDQRDCHLRHPGGLAGPPGHLPATLPAGHRREDRGSGGGGFPARRQRGALGSNRRDRFVDDDAPR